MNARVIKIPQLGALILRVPLPGAVAEGVDAFLGAGLLFIAARAAEGRIKVVVFERIQLRQTRSSAPTERASSSRKVIISANLNPVSTCSRGNGIGAG